MVVVFAQFDRQDGELAQERFDCWGEFSFLTPTFFSYICVSWRRKHNGRPIPTFTDSFLENLNLSLNVGMERILYGCKGRKEKVDENDYLRCRRLCVSYRLGRQR